MVEYIIYDLDQTSILLRIRHAWHIRSKTFYLSYIYSTLRDETCSYTDTDESFTLEIHIYVNFIYSAVRVNYITHSIRNQSIILAFSIISSTYSKARN